jgi:Icc-related predicted phosphoesterase
MKKTILLLHILLAIVLGGCVSKEDSTINFIVVADMGRTGESEQQNIAEIMGRFADDNRIDFMAIAGDPLHYNGATCVNDERWNLMIEDVYTAPSLHAIPWYVVSGNHEYNGSVQAILDYSNVSKRWNAPARYFTKEHTIGKKGQRVLFVFIDTSPLIDKYRNDEKYSDAGEQDMDRQLYWLDSVLMVSNHRWKIVIGHHPVHATTNKQECERTDMQQRVGTILENRNVDMYICGHIHNFQHIKLEGSNVHYVVNSSASRSRPIHEPNFQRLIFSNADPGFMSASVSENTLRFSFINHRDERVYKYTIEK